MPSIYYKSKGRCGYDIHNDKLYPQFVMKKSRSQKALINTVAGVIYEIVTLICGLILPRLILVHFGSAYNGITSSISQFISVISLMKAGIGGVTRVALYKPLSDRDYSAISAVVVQTEKFMKKIAISFIAFVLVFAAIYPIWLNNDFEWLFSATLIIIISMSTFAQYFFGLTYQMVLMADQKVFVLHAFNIVAIIVNTIVSAILILSGCSIHLVKIGSSIVYIITPIVMSAYVKHHYHIDKTVKAETDLIKQRWDAVGHEVAKFVNNNTDIMLLTVFVGLKEVSVYTVYHGIVINGRKIVDTFITGFGAAFGNMLVKKEYDLVNENLRIFELIVFSIVSILYSVIFVMLTPFVSVYTRGVTDVNYFQPAFGYVLTIAGAFSCFRIPYETVVKAAGHYKRTRNGAFAEAIINIVVSIVFVKKFGLIGVAIGTLCAAVFRTFQYAIFLGKHVIDRSIFLFIGHLACSSLSCVLTFLISKLYSMNITSAWDWAVMALITTVVAFLITAVFVLLFYRNDFIILFRKIKGIAKKRIAKKR